MPELASGPISLQTGIDFEDAGPGNKVSLFRRALLRRNIRVITSAKSGNEKLPLWGAMYGGEVRLFRGIMSADVGISVHKLARDKAATKAVLAESGLNVPQSFQLQRDPNFLKRQFADLEKAGLIPGVLKPNSGSHGRGVTMGIRTPDELEAALSLAGESAVFEQQIEGYDYRMLTVGNTLVAATERKPAYVVGDGVSTIKQLVEKKNETRTRNPSTRNHPIKLDSISAGCLAQQNLSETSVPDNGKQVWLRTVANVGSGGEAFDRTPLVHPGFVEICESVPALVGSPEILGIDIIARDISVDPAKQEWAILELNANPDIDLQHWPWAGRRRDIADRLAQFYFPLTEIADPAVAMLQIGGKVRLPKLYRWIESYGVLAGLRIESLESTTGLGLQLVGSQAAIDWFIEMLIRSRTGAIVRSIEISTK